MACFSKKNYLRRRKFVKKRVVILFSETWENQIGRSKKKFKKIFKFFQKPPWKNFCARHWKLLKTLRRSVHVSLMYKVDCIEVCFFSPETRDRCKDEQNILGKQNATQKLPQQSVWGSIIHGVEHDD